MYSWAHFEEWHHKKKLAWRIRAFLFFPPRCRQLIFLVEAFKFFVNKWATVWLDVELWVTVKQGVVVIAWPLGSYGVADRSAYCGVMGDCLANCKVAGDYLPVSLSSIAFTSSYVSSSRSIRALAILSSSLLLLFSSLVTRSLDSCHGTPQSYIRNYNFFYHIRKENKGLVRFY